METRMKYSVQMQRGIGPFLNQPSPFGPRPFIDIYRQPHLSGLSHQSHQNFQKSTFLNASHMSKSDRFLDIS